MGEDVQALLAVAGSFATAFLVRSRLTCVCRSLVPRRWLAL